MIESARISVEIETTRTEERSPQHLPLEREHGVQAKSRNK